MLWATTTLLLTSVTAATAAPLASTYEEAACDAAEVAAAVADERAQDCSLPPASPVMPAVIDCNDERASFFVAEMIGSCDMPKPLNLGAPAIVRAPAHGAPMLCDGASCGHDSSPVRPALRALTDGSPLLVSGIWIPLVFSSTPLPERAELSPPQAFPPRLERPPRAA